MSVRTRFSLASLLLLPALASPASQAMTNLVDAAAAWDCFAAYTNNVLRIEPAEPSEWNPARRIDRLPFASPLQLVVGPATEDRAAAEAALTTVSTSMPANVRAYFARHHLMAPLLQRMIRRYRPGISNETQYVTFAAHPCVWQAKDFDLARLASAARNLTSNDVPMMANLIPVYEGFKENPIRCAAPLVDYPDPRPEQTYATPFCAAIVLRALEQRRKFRFTAVGYPFRDGKVNFKWVGRGVGVGPLHGQRTRYPPERGHADLVLGWGAGRREVLLFARYGNGPWGPPSVVSFYGVPNEKRQYDKDGRILSVEYLARKDVIPQLYQNKPWKDVFDRDALGDIVCFLRTRAGQFHDERFSMTGECVVETYAGDLPKETRKVRYFTRPDDPLTLDYEVTDETVSHPKTPFEPRTRGEFPLPKRRKR